ncbi:hypothetical protein DFH27DRAFT_577287 [Peziza echinospora]|nr:hypothetical protein DFH27DRAFT_577287 [Peziza echinospora]
MRGLSWRNVKKRWHGPRGRDHATDNSHNNNNNNNTTSVDIGKQVKSPHTFNQPGNPALGRSPRPKHQRPEGPLARTMSVAPPRTPAKRNAELPPPSGSPSTHGSPSVRSRKRRQTSEPASTAIALGSFKLVSDVAQAFGLSYSDIGTKHLLELGELQPVAHAVPAQLPCLMRAVTGHCTYFHRGSEAICRTLVDLVLMESLFILNGGPHSHTHGSTHTQTSPPLSPAPPPPADACTLARALVVNGGVAIRWTDPVTGTAYAGLADYSVGIAAPAPANPATHRYSALLLLAEAKHANNVDAAEAQLAAYLAVLHKHRAAERRRTQAHSPLATATVTAVHGFATDGLRYTFMTVDAAGTVRCSNRMQLRVEADARAIVGAVVGVLERELRLREDVLRRSRPSSRASSGGRSVAVSAAVSAEAAPPAEDASLLAVELLEASGMIDDAPVTDTLSGAPEDDENVDPFAEQYVEAY